jgi:hypothetical protein
VFPRALSSFLEREIQFKLSFDFGYILSMNLFNIDFSLVSADGFKLFRKIDYLYWKPHYFLVGAVSSSLLANTTSFPFYKHLLSTKFYLSSHWLTFILDVGSRLCNWVGIFLVLVWIWASLAGASEENPYFYGWKKSLDLYLGMSCFFSNILITITPSINKFGDLIDGYGSSVGFGLGCSMSILFVACFEGVKSFLELGD